MTSTEHQDGPVEYEAPLTEEERKEIAFELGRTSLCHWCS